MFYEKRAILSGRPATPKQKRFQGLLSSINFILNPIQIHSTVLGLKKEVIGLLVKFYVVN